MTQKNLSASGRDARVGDQPSLTTRIRLARHARRGRANEGAQANTYLSAKTRADTPKPVRVKTSACAVCPTDIPLLLALIDAVRTRSHERERCLKEREVLAIVGRSKAAMRRDVSLGLFPAPIKIGIKSSAWRESEVTGWVDATTILSRTSNPGFGMKDFIAALGILTSQAGVGA